MLLCEPSGDVAISQDNIPYHHLTIQSWQYIRQISPKLSSYAPSLKYYERSYSNQKLLALTEVNLAVLLTHFIRNVFFTLRKDEIYLFHHQMLD